MTGKTIALVDGFDDGHHLTHLRNYARALLEGGHRVLELLPEPSDVESWLRERAPNLISNVRFAPFRHESAQSPSWRLRRVYEPLAAWRHAGQAVRRAASSTGMQPDLVFFCWLDDYIVGCSPVGRHLVPFVFPYRWSGVFFHPWHLRSGPAPCPGTGRSSPPPHLDNEAE